MDAWTANFSTELRPGPVRFGTSNRWKQTPRRRNFGGYPRSAGFPPQTLL